MALVIQGVLMPEICHCPGETGRAVCELPSGWGQQPARTLGSCSACGQKGKPVHAETVKALLSVSLRAVRDAEYLFCRTRSCPIVYFTPDRSQTFTAEDMGERVYQKEPGTDMCLCATAFGIRLATCVQRHQRGEQPFWMISMRVSKQDNVRVMCAIPKARAV